MLQRLRQLLAQRTGVTTPALGALLLVLAAPECLAAFVLAAPAALHGGDSRAVPGKVVCALIAGSGGAAIAASSVRPRPDPSSALLVRCATRPRPVAAHTRLSARGASRDTGRGAPIYLLTRRLRN